MNDRLHPTAAAALAASDRPADNGAKILLDTLIAHGVDTVFGYPGGAVLPLYDALYAEPRLKHVLVRHEQAAVHAAEGYARTTGRTGVVFVTSGPGMANTTSGLLDAMCDSIPVLCISGQVATAAIGTDAFQECDAIGISRSVTKWNTQIRAVDDVAGVVGRAFELTRQGRPGPVLVDFPKDVQLAAPRDADDGIPAAPTQQKLAALRARRQAGKLAPKLPQSAVRRAAALIAQATYAADRLAQTRRLGEWHHAIAAGLVADTDTRPELGQIIAGEVPGRTRPDEITIADLTGTGIQDNLADKAAKIGLPVWDFRKRGR